LPDKAMAYIDFIGVNHSKTRRDYIGRVNAHDKAAVSEIAIQYGRDYWDGERHLGYGGYRYDGRWRAVAQAMIDHYGIEPGARILDVGCGKGFLLHELAQILGTCEIAGLDVSTYAIDNAKEEVKAFIKLGHARELPWPDRHFDFVLSINALHNLYNWDLDAAVREIERVGRDAKYICVEGYRNEREKVNLLYWQLTCRAFHHVDEWDWLFRQCGYTGDFSCIYFE
jgi:protein-L-isoaspartate(D-aspartate) O-methyltransferase